MDNTFFPTSTPAVAQELQTKINEQQDRISMLNKQVTHYVHKIATVKEYISEVYMETGEIPDELAEIARMLQIDLTKPISGEAIFTISWTAQVPLDFDPDDMEITFSVDCQSDVDDFEWHEEDTEIHGRDCF
jgi:hypothetical protein